MKSKIAGVALAAVAGACALGGADQAAQAAYIADFTISGTGDVNDGIVSYWASGTFYSRTGSTNFSYSYQIYNFQTTNTMYGSGNGYEKNVKYSFEPLDPMLGNGDAYISVTGDYIGFYSSIYSISDTKFLGGTLDGYGRFQAPNGPAGAGSNNIIQFLTVTQVSDVPLPSAAPLFGAALLALSGATYARRRSQKAA